MKLSRRDRKLVKIELYVKQIGRPARSGGSDSNDRPYDHKVERRLRKMKPEELDALLNGD